MTDIKFPVAGNGPPKTLDDLERTLDLCDKQGGIEAVMAMARLFANHANAEPDAIKAARIIACME